MRRCGLLFGFVGAGFAALVFPLACGSSEARALVLPCEPPAGTYVVRYTNETDSSLCQAPPDMTVTLPFDAGLPIDAGIACDTTPRCAQTCSGTIEGYQVSAVTTVSIDGSSYSGTNRQTTTLGDATISNCEYSYSASME